MEDLAQSVPNMRLTDQKQITKNTESKGSVERVTSVTQKFNSLLPSPSNYSVEVKEIEEKLKKLTILSSSKKKHLLTEERQHVKTALDTLPAQSNTEFNVFVECSSALEPLSLSDSESSETPLSDSYDKSSGFEDQSHVRLETTEEKNEAGCIQELPNIIITDPYTSQTTDIAKDKNTIQATFIYEDQSYGQQKETYASASSNTYTIEDCHTNITEITGDDIQMDNYAKSIGSDLIQETRKNREYYCDICKTTTPTEDIYRKHLVNEHEIIPEPFIVSGKAQMDNSIVNRSRVEKSRENGAGDRSSVGDIYCALCQRHYMDKNYLRIHAQAVHPKEFIEWTQMNFQKPTYRGNSNTIYKCVKCDSKLEGITSLQRHYLDVHETPLKVVYPTDKLYVGDTEKEMNLLSALYDIYGPIFGSETTHQPVLDDLQIHCRVCSKKFENPGDYVDHNLTPHDDAPASPIKHTLDVLRFTDSLKTDIDLDNVVYDDKDPDFYCSLCDIKCDKSAAFADHKRSNIHLHNSSYKISEPPNFNPLFYYCNICNRGYDTENSILNHVKYNHANAQMLSKNQTHINPVFILPKVESKTIENELDHRSVVIRDTIKAIMNKPMKECNAISEITCGVCDTLQTTTSRLRSHMEKKHNFEQCTEMLFYCYICLIDCRKESIFSVHIATRKHMKAALRPENRLINVHQVSIDYTDNERDYCEVCRTAFQNPRLYMNHKATINHQINYLISTSQHAPSTEPTQDALVLWNRYMNIVRTHRTRLATPGQLEFNCNICRISFTSSMHCLLHLATRLHKTNCMTEIIETSNSDEETDTDACNTEEETGQEACDLEEVTNKEVCDTEEVTNKACYTEEENGQEARNLQDVMDKEAQTQDINSKQSQSKDITYSKSNVREVLPNFYCKACDKPFKFLSQFQSHSITRGHRQALRNNTLQDNTKVSNDTEVFNDTENFDDDGSDYCNEFDSNSVLSQYEEILPENSFDNSYDCKLCNVSYSEPYLLADHLSTPNHKRFLESTIYRDEVRKAERDIADNTHCGPSIFSPGGFKDLAIGRQEYQTSTHTSAEKLNNVFQLTFNMEKEKAMPISSVANYHCELCDVSFYSANVLTNHLLTKDHKEKMNSTTSVEESTVFPLTRMAEPQNIPENFSTVEPLAKCKVIRENKNTEPKIKNTTIPFDLDLHCDSCDKTFTTKHSSLMHFFKMHKSYYPDLSPKNQPQRKLNAVGLHKHNIMPDQNNPKLFCRACRKIFNNKGNFRLHLMSKHKMNLNEDNLPGNNLNMTEYQAHTISQDVRKFYCVECDKSYLTRGRYLLHLGNIHNCDENGKQLNGIRVRFRLRTIEAEKNSATVNDRIHLESNNMAINGDSNAGSCNTVPDKVDRFEQDTQTSYCTKCDRRYQLISSYKRHCKMKHSDRKIQSKTTDGDKYCAICAKQFKHHSAYMKHCMAKHSSYQRPLTRGRLLKKGRSLETSEQHTVIHKDLTGLYCDKCDTKYISQRLYTKHVSIRHSEVNVNTEIDRYLYCIKCDKEYSSIFWYNQHLNRKHAIKNGTLDNGNVVRDQSATIIDKSVDAKLNYCETCNIQFSSPYTYYYHRNTKHPNEIKRRVYIQKYCEECNKQFSTQLRYHNHCNRKHKDKIKLMLRTKAPVAKSTYCKKCNIHFANPRRLYYHRRTIHLNEAKPFSNNKRTPDHSATSTPVATGSNHCNKCNKNFRNKRLYVVHCNNLHPAIVAANSSKNRNVHNQPVTNKAPASVEFDNQSNEAVTSTQISDVKLSNSKSFISCCICNCQYISSRLYENHPCFTKPLGPTKRKRGRPVKNTILKTYCSICEVDYEDHHKYNAHLFLLHEKTLKDGSISLSNLVVGDKESILTCQSCNHTYGTTFHYNSHIVKFHNQLYQNQTISHEKNNHKHPLYCFSCKHDYDSYASFNTHLYDMHHVSKPKLIEMSRKASERVRNDDTDCNARTMAGEKVLSLPVTITQPGYTPAHDGRTLRKRTRMNYVSCVQDLDVEL